MESVKFDRIVSVNSEIEGHGARNLLDEEIRPNKNWMCEKGTEKAVVILQLDKPTVFASIHVGNAHSAFVEILVGKAADTDQHFESLLPMSILMKPHECKSGENKNQTRFFGKADFNEATAAKPWDRIKVVCSQPFNKHIPYGLCFLKVQGVKQNKKVDLPTRSDEGEIPIGSFFRKKRESDGNKPLTVSEQIKQVEKESSQTPINISKWSAKLGDKPSSEKKRIGEKNTEKILDVKTPKIRKNEDRTPEREKKEENSPKRRKDETPKKHDEDKKHSKKKSKEKDDRMSKKRKEETAKRRKKPFQKLMDDVVLVISGFKNPLRGDIRSMALEMGARYSSDWDSRCTHLVCAYENTPKFHQVKGKGKIVKKDWLEKCHKDKKRYPWRRFALDQRDCKQPESEEEVDGADEADPEEEDTTSPEARTSQDEKRKLGSPLKPSSDHEYDLATDDDDDDDDDEKKKDKTEVETTDYPMPFLPDLFSSKTFFVDPNIKERKVLERYIIAYNGTITETFNEEVEYYVTDRGGTPVELFRKKVPNLVAIKPSWIWEVRSKLECVPKTPHLVK